MMTSSSSSSAGHSSDERPLVLGKVPRRKKGITPVLDADASSVAHAWPCARCGCFLACAHLTLGASLLLLDVVTNSVSRSAFAVTAALVDIVCALLAFIAARRIDRCALWLLLGFAVFAALASLSIFVESSLVLNRMCETPESFRDRASLKHKFADGDFASDYDLPHAMELVAPMDEEDPDLDLDLDPPELTLALDTTEMSAAAIGEESTLLTTPPIEDVSFQEGEEKEEEKEEEDVKETASPVRCHGSLHVVLATLIGISLSELVVCIATMMVCFRSLRAAFAVRDAASPYSTLIIGDYRKLARPTRPLAPRARSVPPASKPSPPPPPFPLSVPTIEIAPPSPLIYRQL